ERSLVDGNGGSRVPYRSVRGIVRESLSGLRAGQGENSTVRERAGDREIVRGEVDNSRSTGNSQVGELSRSPGKGTREVLRRSPIEGHGVAGACGEGRIVGPVPAHGR